MKNKKRTETFTARLNEEDRENLEELAKTEGKSKADVVSDGINFYTFMARTAGLKKRAEKEGFSIAEYIVKNMLFALSFPEGFFKVIKKLSDDALIPEGVVVSNLLQYFIARDRAIESVFPGATSAWNEAFRRDSGGKLIKDDRLSEMTFNETKAKLEILRARMVEDAKHNRKTYLNEDELSLVAGAFRA